MSAEDAANGKPLAVGALDRQEGGPDDSAARMHHLVPEKQWPVEVAPTLNAASASKQGLEDQHALNGAGWFAPREGFVKALTTGQRLDPETEDFVAFNLRGREGGAQAEVAEDGVSIRAASGGSSRSYVAHTLTAEGYDASEDGTGRGTPLTTQGFGVRRLTPTECERLQGFPDGHTLLPDQIDGSANPKPDSHRYSQMGNAVTVDVAYWIGRRIMAEVGK